MTTNTQTIKSSFENILTSSKRILLLFESDRGNEFYNSNFQSFINNNNIKHFSRNSSLVAVTAERFNRTIRDRLKRPVFERRGANWVDILPTKSKQDDNRTHSSTKLSPIESFLKKNEKFIHQNLLGKRKKYKPKWKRCDLVRTADLKRTFSEGDTTNGITINTKLQKLLMIQCRVIVLITYQSVITKPYWKRLIKKWKKTKVLWKN